jgi:hypothetical protein
LIDRVPFALRAHFHSRESAKIEAAMRPAASVHEISRVSGDPLGF